MFLSLITPVRDIQAINRETQIVVFFLLDKPTREILNVKSIS